MAQTSALLQTEEGTFDEASFVEQKFSRSPPGDPKADLAFERQYEQQTYHVIPEVIKNFLQYFHKTISDLIDQKVYELQSNRVSSESIEQKIYEIQDVYENRYGRTVPLKPAQDDGHEPD